jgi:hypothetical protein
MPETKRFDPLGWFFSACCTLLAGAVALTVAVHLIAAVWVALALVAGVVLLAGFVVMLATWWHRRQPW